MAFELVETSFGVNSPSGALRCTSSLMWCVHWCCGLWFLNLSQCTFIVRGFHASAYARSVLPFATFWQLRVVMGSCEWVGDSFVLLPSWGRSHGARANSVARNGAGLHRCPSSLRWTIGRRGYLWWSILWMVQIQQGAGSLLVSIPFYRCEDALLR